MIVATFLVGFYQYIGYPLLILDKSLGKNQPHLVFCVKFLNPKPGDLKPGDLVAFDPPINTAQYGLLKPSRKYLKRLYAINPNVEYKGDTVIVNGKVLQRSLEGWRRTFPIVVDNYKGKMFGYFVLGDVINSIDSRYFGTIMHVDKCYRLF